MSGYAVDLADLAALVERMRHFQRQVSTARDGVERRVADLHVVWSGDAARAHVAAHRTWDSAAAQTQETLAALQSIVASAHENYVSAMQANRRMWVR